MESELHLHSPHHTFNHKSASHSFLVYGEPYPDGKFFPNVNITVINQYRNLALPYGWEWGLRRQDFGRRSVCICDYQIPHVISHLKSEPAERNLFCFSR